MIDIFRKTELLFNFYNERFEKILKGLKKEDKIKLAEDLIATISADLTNSITRVEKAEEAERKEKRSNEFKEYIRKIQKFGDEEFFIKTFGETLDRRYGNSKEEGSSMPFSDWIENFLNENS